MKQYQQVCTSGFLLNDKNEVLLVKRSDTDDFLPGLWEMPGGGLDFGENPVIGLQRELKEEIGLDVEVDKPLYVDDYFMNKEWIPGHSTQYLLPRSGAVRDDKSERIHRVEIFFLCTVQDSSKIILSNEHTTYKWVSKENLNKSEVTEYMYKALRECFKNNE